MRDLRLNSLDISMRRRCDVGRRYRCQFFEDIFYYLKPTEGQGRTWDDVPQEIKDTFDKLGIPQAERQYLAGVKAQFESEVVYGSLKEDLAQQGVIFLDTDSALRDHPDLMREYFGKIIPPTDNKFAAFNSAVWSRGSFIYVQPGVKIEFPLQAYFRINAENMGQFERTLIIVDEGLKCTTSKAAQLQCTAARACIRQWSKSFANAAAAAVTRPFKNWANNIYNLVTKRAMAYGDATMEWVDGNLGSKLTMKYPAVYMMVPGARGEILSIAFASGGQHQDAGGKLVHAAPHTTDRSLANRSARMAVAAAIVALVRVEKNALTAVCNVVCDALILIRKAAVITYPYIEISNKMCPLDTKPAFLASARNKLFYLMSRGLSEAEASTMIVNGFIEPLVKELPMEYAVEMNRLIQLQMEGSVGLRRAIGSLSIDRTRDHFHFHSLNSLLT